MIYNKKVLAIIPARAGSKGLKNKNIKIFNKKPLICWTLDQAKKSHQLGFLWSSSEKVVFQSLIKEVLKDCLVLKNTIPHERITNFLTGHRFQFKIAMYRLVTEELRTDGQHLLFPLFDHTILHNLRRHPRYDFEESERVFCHFTNPFDKFYFLS